MTAFALLLVLLGCTAEPLGDSATAVSSSACDCDTPVHLAFAPTRVGGFDDWSGNAVVWAVDETGGRLLVVAMAYDLGVPVIEREVACEDPEATARAWVPSVPASAAEDAATYPLLAAALTNAAGVRSLPEDVGAVLLEGDFRAAIPTRVRVASGGQVTLTRGEGGGDRLLGALTFATLGEGLPGAAAVSCDAALRLGGLDLRFSATGDER